MAASFEVHTSRSREQRHLALKREAPLFALGDRLGWSRRIRCSDGEADDERTIRGGFWANDPARLRVSYRVASRRGRNNLYVGVALEPQAHREGCHHGSHGTLRDVTW